MSQRQRFSFDFDSDKLDATVAYLESLPDVPNHLRDLTQSLRESVQASTSNRSTPVWDTPPAANEQSACPCSFG